MRFSLSKLAAAAGSLTSKELRAKYNYKVREYNGPFDEIHTYYVWCVKNKRELWPLMACFVFWGGFVTYMIGWAFMKTGVQMNRFTEHKPWDWERAQYEYNKRKKAFYNDKFIWKRIPELDKLQGEMLEAKRAKLAAMKEAHRKHAH